ncbi:hypothetical protein EYF80_057307 [Liparis tanakae]|uniref:Uncharacterized protein n=1 Tax=Liparis tanakae TaxID=230148 RepID=A0A4Z2EWB8_9TELE|nr:hypothetical protein EYF80_057307 [Liparis tanakae]
MEPRRTPDRVDSACARLITDGFSVLFPEMTRRGQAVGVKGQARRGYGGSARRPARLRVSFGSSLTAEQENPRTKRNSTEPRGAEPALPPWA